MTATGDGRSRIGVVTAYGAVLTVLGVVLAVTAVILDTPVEHRGLFLQWWVLAGLFVVAHSLVLNVQTARETRSVVLTEIPLVIGLVLVPPLGFVAGRLAGALVGQAVLRRQWRNPWKLAFNLSVVVAEGGVGLAVFHVLAAPTSRAPQTWIAAGVAATLASIVGAIGVAALVARLDGATVGLRGLVAVVWESLPQTLAVTTVGVVATTALITSAWAALPLVIVGVVVAFAYRAYARLVERHENVERLYQFTQAISSHTDTDAIVAGMLEKVGDILHAEVALLSFFAGDDPRPDSEAVLRRGTSLERRPAEYLTADAGWIIDRLCRDEKPVLFGRDTKDAAGRHWLDTAGLREALMVPLRGERGVAATLIVADRLGEARGFDDTDLQLLQTAANHASVALRHGQLVDRLRYDSLHDSLTGVPNRAYLQHEVERRLESLPSGGAPFAVAMLDLDAFKDVNDTLGHHHGDALLCEVADRLSTAIGRRSVVGRFGGDEFALLFPDCRTAEDAERLCRVVLDALVEPVLIDGTAVDVSASIGIACAPEHADNWAELMKRADLSMYLAKQAGREVVVYDPAQDLSSPSRLALVAALRQGIADDELTIHVQPQVSFETGTVTCVEALARWERPGHGIVPPDEFIPLAERTGLIRPMTDVILEKAIAACAGWQGVAPGIGVAVNLSARSLRDDGLDEQVERLLRRHDLPAHLLTLEITESSVMADAASTLGLLHRLRLLGLRLSIDDFGTGYSSLSYLRRLPVQEVKVDRSFVQRMHIESDDAAIVRSIIELAGTLGLHVVAEGVEESPTYELLESLGCHFAQGYLISRPVPVDDFVAWMTKTPWTSARRPQLVAVNQGRSRRRGNTAPAPRRAAT